MEDFPLQLRHPSGAVMDLERDRVLVAAGGPAAGAGRQGLLDRLGLVAEPEAPAAPTARAGTPTGGSLNNTDTRTFARTADGSAFRPTALDRGPTAAAAGVDWVAPVYRVSLAGRTELVSPLPHALVVRVVDRKRTDELLSRLREAGLEEDTERSRYLGADRYLRIADPLEQPAYTLRDELVARFGTALEIRMELMPVLVPTSMVPNDPEFPDQWSMERVRAGGPGQTAWNLQQGDPAVIVCVLDEGCELAHPDLVGQYVHGGINLGTMAGNGGPTGNHGTPCAGIVAANTGNGIGVAGMAGDCRILPVAFSAWTDVEVAAGIRYATAQGARVISMSFGWDPWDPAIIDPAIQEAFDADVVMCVATHNYDTANGITYPATNPLVMACGASDQADNRKSPASPDGEPWGSNYGPQISVVAPGVLCPSTDRLGLDGYTAGDYTPDFNGTSAATPHLAGLAALVRSADPALTNVDVREIIEQTAAKVGAVPYAVVAGHPNGTWNEEMGYGRIDALSAVQRAGKSVLADINKVLQDKQLNADKHPLIDNVGKLPGHKEKERIDEVKGLLGGLEGPDWRDRILEHVLERLERLEGPGNGRPFIDVGQRPEVGGDVVRRARAGEQG